MMKGCLSIILVSLAIVLCFMFPFLSIPVIVIASIIVGFLLFKEVFLFILNLYWTLYGAILDLFVVLISNSSPSFSLHYDKYRVYYITLFEIVCTIFLIHITGLRFLYSIIISLVIAVPSLFRNITAKRAISEELWEMKKANLIRSGKSYEEALDYLNERYTIE